MAVPIGPTPPDAMFHSTVLAALLLGSLPSNDPASPPASNDDLDLTELSLEELMDIEVTIASRNKQPLSDSPAAVYVITGDELRRSGHTSVQEALRMVPGFHVAQWKTSGWDVTSRGFTGSLSALNESFTNQMLLMVDGVSLYSPVMAGIWWPLLDIPLADIDRIEIIRGASGTLWGANAVNGVIHVITKDSAETQGGLVHGHLGDLERSGDVRHGGTLGENGTYRVWSSYSRYDALPTSDGNHVDEDWWIASAGGRFDWVLPDDGRLRLRTSAYTSQFGEELWDADVGDYAPFDDTPKNGGMLSTSWEFGAPEDRQRLQAWFLADHQKQFNFEHDVQSLDLEYTRTHAGEGPHVITWGVGGRAVYSDLAGDNGYLDFEPESRHTYGVRAFVQDQIDLPSLDSKLVLGAQLEDHSLSDPQFQPNVRWLWKPTADETLWAAISRAVRTPSLEEADIVQRFDSNGSPFFRGTDDFDSEEVLSHELGVRSQLGESVHLDVSGFYNDFDDLQSIEVHPANGTADTFGNLIDARSYGAEVALDAQLAEDWRLRSGYSYFRMDFRADKDSAEVTTADWRDDMIPKHRVNLRSYYDIGEDWELDVAAYWTDENSTFFFENSDYYRVDARLGWNPSEDIRVSFGVQNLTETEHVEAGEDIWWIGSVVERVFYVSLTASF